ncbi:unnamed protein product [Parajaminaea phylloscopi]
MAAPKPIQLRWSNRTMILLSTVVGSSTFLIGATQGYAAGKKQGRQEAAQEAAQEQTQDRAAQDPPTPRTGSQA